MFSPQRVLVVFEISHETNCVENYAGSKEDLHLFVVEELLVVGLESGLSGNVVEFTQPDSHLAEEDLESDLGFLLGGAEDLVEVVVPEIDLAISCGGRTRFLFHAGEHGDVIIIK